MVEARSSQLNNSMEDHFLSLSCFAGDEQKAFLMAPLNETTVQLMVNTCGWTRNSRRQTDTLLCRFDQGQTDISLCRGMGLRLGFLGSDRSWDYFVGYGFNGFASNGIHFAFCI